MKTIMALDIGSGSMRARLAGLDGTVLAEERGLTPAHQDPSGGFYFEGVEIREAARHLVRSLQKRHGKAETIAIAFSCLGTSMLPVGPRGQALAPALSPLDRRPPIDLPEDLSLREIYGRTGQNPVLPSSFHHLRWRLAGEGAQWPADTRFRSLRGMLVEQLCGQAWEDHSWASRTMLYRLDRDDWDEALLAKAGLRRGQLPPLCGASQAFRICPVAAAEWGLSPEAFVAPGGLDNCCGVLGSGAGPDEMVNVTGTFEHLAARMPGEAAPDFVIEGGALAFRWLEPGQLLVCSRTHLGKDLQDLLKASEGRIQEHFLNRDLPPGPEPRELAPGSPEAAIISLMDRATLEMKAFMEHCEQASTRARRIVVIGGGADAPASLQRKANLLNRPLHVPEDREASLRGALQIAWTAATGKPLKEATALFANPISRIYEPQQPQVEAFQRRHKRYLLSKFDILPKFPV